MLCIRSFTHMIIFLKVLHFCFQLVYQTLFILDECSSLVNLPHQFQSTLNVYLIFKLYLFSWFPQFLNGMAGFIQVSLAIIFYAYHPIFFWYSIRFLFWLSTILLFSLRGYLRRPVVFFAASLIIFIYHAKLKHIFLFMR